MKKTACFAALLACAAFLFSFGLDVKNSRAAENVTFAVAYSGNIMGYFESCG